jgi:hypothetical protein
MSIEKLQEALTDGWPDEYGNVVSDAGWYGEGKYDYRQVVIQIKDSEVGIEDGFYRCTVSRTGSYYTDYEYGEWDVEKVEPYQETITMYRKVDG